MGNENVVYPRFSKSKSTTLTADLQDGVNWAQSLHFNPSPSSLTASPVSTFISWTSQSSMSRTRLLPSMRIILNEDDPSQAADAYGFQGGDTVAGLVEVEIDSFVILDIKVFFQGFIRTWLPSFPLPIPSSNQRTSEYKVRHKRTSKNNVHF